MLDGKVAVVTGGGRGLGRAEAIALAQAGARVVVNDLGDDDPAGAVVEEIRALGGEATAHRGDAAGFDEARRLVELATSTYGDLHVLVNNAGILRDRLIFNMSAEEWDDVIRVHLRGHFCTSRWATAWWRERSKEAGGPVYGRVVNTASEAFLSGSVLQPNYAAAKAGIVALTLSIAQACEKYGVTANAICPRALTRLTEHLESMRSDVYDPAHVAALVVFLASPASARVSGQVFVAYGSHVSVVGGLRVERVFATEEAWTTDALSEVLVPFFAEREPIRDGFQLRVGG